MKLLLIEINFYILWRTRINNFLKVMKLSQITVLKLRTIFLKLCQNNYMHENSTSFETGLIRYNVCNLIPQLPLYLRFSYCKHSNKKTCITCQNNFLKLCQKDNLCQSGETSKLLLIEINFYILYRTRITNFLKVMKLSQITVLKLRTIFLKLCQNDYIQ